MPNGKPGDHPLTDITVHRIPTFSPEVDELIRDVHRRRGRMALENLTGGKWELTREEIESLRLKLIEMKDQL